MGHDMGAGNPHSDQRGRSRWFRACPVPSQLQAEALHTSNVMT